MASISMLRMNIIITISMPDNPLALSRLFQLISPSLPIGSYTYSQGIEWAVEQGWIKTEQDLQDWLGGLLDTTQLYLELPLLIRMMQAWQAADQDALTYWNSYLLASRETAELRQEELNRARAFAQVIISLQEGAMVFKPQLIRSQHACFSYACVAWGVTQEQACYGLLWSWLENLALSAIKIIPLGQTAGQQVVFKLSEKFPQIIAQALTLQDDDIGASSMALAIASSRHETQYTRLFRS
jgi:urease accessory protein